MREALYDRMANKSCRKPVPFKIRRLEWQQSKDMIQKLRHFFGTARTPCPDAWRDVMNAGNGPAACFYFFDHAETKIRRVYRNHGIRLCFQDFRRRLPDARQNMKQPRQHFGNAHNGKIFHREQAAQAGFCHTATADAGKLHIRMLHFKSAHQRSPQKIPGRLSGDQKYAQRPVHDALNPVTKIPSRSAASVTVSRSSISEAPASMAIPSRPAS